MSPSTASAASPATFAPPSKPDDFSKANKYSRLAYHLSLLARACICRIQPFEGYAQVHDDASRISLAGGLPIRACFPSNPQASLHAVPQHPFAVGVMDLETETVSIIKYADAEHWINWSEALQYGVPTGLYNVGKRISKPGYDDFCILVRLERHREPVFYLFPRKVSEFGDGHHILASLVSKSPLFPVFRSGPFPQVGISWLKLNLRTNPTFVKLSAEPPSGDVLAEDVYTNVFWHQLMAEGQLLMAPGGQDGQFKRSLPAVLSNFCEFCIILTTSIPSSASIILSTLAISSSSLSLAAPATNAGDGMATSTSVHDARDMSSRANMQMRSPDSGPQVSQEGCKHVSGVRTSFSNEPTTPVLPLVPSKSCKALGDELGKILGDGLGKSVGDTCNAVIGGLTSAAKSSKTSAKGVATEENGESSAQAEDVRAVNEGGTQDTPTIDELDKAIAMVASSISAHAANATQSTSAMDYSDAPEASSTTNSSSVSSAPATSTTKSVSGTSAGAPPGPPPNSPMPPIPTPVSKPDDTPSRKSSSIQSSDPISSAQPAPSSSA
ncbi:hypothetical protein FISHEDRAFT_70502 [Fistulina hepatica ATCC 64428]|uniref:Uncharacterized protein n=1 Tax=Fistulina hepatica ATCC 64428 TaxID=1128425 RepID=A0A0D7AIU2_9AGAR|nr:hypothetical protein FISHEDRAFT_70502 [Fistulina hepatica ATCC 64428]